MATSMFNSLAWSSATDVLGAARCGVIGIAPTGRGGGARAVAGWPSQLPARLLRCCRLRLKRTARSDLH